VAKGLEVSEILIFYLQIVRKIEILVGGVMHGLTGLTELFV